MRLAVVGASGRMGRAVVALARADGIDVVCAVGTTEVGHDAGDLAGVGPIGACVVDALAAIEHARADVVVDFSSPDATAALAPLAAAAGSAIVVGTTGLDHDTVAALERASEEVPVFREPNMSVGVHVLRRLLASAIVALGDWDIEIVEIHHRAKVDAPSGTALRLAETARAARAGETRPVYGRHGRPGARGGDEIGVHAVRGGDVVGDHTAYLFGGGERLELTHRATSRQVFAHGALRAARWIAARDRGLYTMDDMLGAVKT